MTAHRDGFTFLAWFIGVVSLITVMLRLGREAIREEDRAVEELARERLHEDRTTPQ